MLKNLKEQTFAAKQAALALVFEGCTKILQMLPWGFGDLPNNFCFPRI
jgi:hypothetical protein